MALPLLLTLAVQAEPQVAVITHPDNPVAELTPGALQDILLLRRQFWEGGVRITLVRIDGDPAHSKLVAEAACRCAADDLDQAILSRHYRGALATRVVDTRDAAEALQVVAQQKSAIAFVPAEAVDDTVRVLGTFSLAGAEAPAAGGE